MSNCRNCGAPRDSKCHYCGTVYGPSGVPITTNKNNKLTIYEILAIVGFVMCPGICLLRKYKKNG